jgi:hypothetical protein
MAEPLQPETVRVLSLYPIDKTARDAQSARNETGIL